MIETFETEDKEYHNHKKVQNKKKSSISLPFILILGIAIISVAFISYSFTYSSFAQEKEKRYTVLIGDIGGTHVRLSLIGLSKSPDVEPVQYDSGKLSPKNFPSLEAVLREYLSKFKDNLPLVAVIGIPGPVNNNEILGITNIPHWKRESGDEMAKKLGIKKLVFLNDFACNGYGIQTKLKLGEDYIILNDVKPQEGGAKAVIGPGTGLGMGFLVKDPLNEYYTIGNSEGGHQDFTPKTEKFFRLREYYKKLYGYDNLSIERLLSGQGMIPLYKFLLEEEMKEGKTVERDAELAAKVDAFQDFGNFPKANSINVEITQKGVKGICKHSRKVLETFIELFGETAGDISLFTLPTNGLYLVGGISVAIEPLIKSSTIFMDHFLNKDNFAFLLKTFPVYLVKNGNIGMLGARECARRMIQNEP